MIQAKDNYQEAVKPATARGLTQLGDSHSDKVERPYEHPGYSAESPEKPCLSSRTVDLTNEA